MNRDISVPCAIKGCTNFTKVHLGWELEPQDFVLCEQCETSVMIDNLVTMERTGHLMPPGIARDFALAFNTWKRTIKGSAVPHRPINLAMLRPLVRPLGEDKV